MTEIGLLPGSKHKDSSTKVKAKPSSGKRSKESPVKYKMPPQNRAFVPDK